MIENDTYKTILELSEAVLFKDRNSKFYGYVFPMQTADAVKPIIATLKKQHHTAGHWCYAYQVGVEKIQYRANDDGEPSNSAGMPIYGQIKSYGLTNVLVVVVRYFGGTKLGVGGLITAYKTTAKMAIEASKISVKTIDYHYTISFDYALMSKVMRVIKEQQLELITQTMKTDCNIVFAVRKKNKEKVISIFKSMYQVKFKAITL